MCYFFFFALAFFFFFGAAFFLATAFFFGAAFFFFAFGATSFTSFAIQGCALLATAGDDDPPQRDRHVM